VKLSTKQWVLVVLGVASMLLAWVAATGPFDAPDEAAHYLRAMGLSNGQLVGPRVPLPSSLDITPLQRAWAQRDTRGVLVTAVMSPPLEHCTNGRPVEPGSSCIEPTNTGDYQPLPYLVPALAILASHDASTGLWLSRIASAFLCLGFLVLAMLLLRDESWGPLLGILLAFSPAVFFVTSVLNPNGLEIASSLALAAAILRVGRSPVSAEQWVWGALALSAVVATLSWQLGPVFVLIDLVLVAVAAGPKGMRTLSRAHATQIRWVLVAVAMALGLFLGYGFASGALHSSFSLFPLIQSLREGAHQLKPVLRQAVGEFGALTIPLPSAAYWVWWLLVVCLIGSAVAMAKRRERWVIASVVAVAAAFPALFYAWIYRGTGFGLQGRYMLPVLVLPPLVAGEVIRRHDARIPLRIARWLAPAVLALIASFQLFAWDVAARNAAGTPHSVWFISHASWHPPLGWWPWASLAILGTAALLAAAATGAGSRSSVSKVTQTGAAL
jgi:ABC-type multidrug transport system fused ATPase/permease subunit